MSGRARILAAAAALAGAAALLAAAGCGEKIGIPEPIGVFGLRTYKSFLSLEDDAPRQLVQVEGSLYVVGGDALVKRDIYFTETGRVAGLAEPTAICYEPETDRIAVWEQGTRTVRWYTRDLQEAGAAPVAEPVRVTAMAASPRGAELESEAVTFLYLSDAEGGAIHRYGVDVLGGLSAHGLLARSAGNAVRDVHVPAGLARDADDHVLVCDRDSLRNWVIRFDPTPDPADADLRGLAAIYATAPVCAPTPAAAEYVLGNAPTCGQTNWVPGPLDSTGVFAYVEGVTVGRAGRIYVADTGNDRVQIFDRYGVHDLTFGNGELTPHPTAIAAFDYRYGATADAYYYGALVFVVLPETNQLRSFVSAEYDEFLNRQPRPQE